MNNCPQCGSPNPDHAKFCKSCGHPLQSVPPVTPPPVPMPQQPKKSNGMKIALIISVAFIAVLILVIGMLLLPSDTTEEKVVETVHYDSAIVNGTWDDVDTAAVTPAPAEKPAEKSVSQNKSTAKGTIDGYPFSLSGKWVDNRFTGTYTNEYNGVKMKCDGYEAEGVLELTLTSGKTKCYFTLDDLGDGYFTGTFRPGNKSVVLQFKY